MGEGEDSPPYVSQPSSPPKKFRLDKEGHFQNLQMPLRPSEQPLPDQANMTVDLDCSTMSHPGHEGLLGAESVVCRAPYPDTEKQDGRHGLEPQALDEVPDSTWQEGSAGDSYQQTGILSQWSSALHPESHGCMQYPTRHMGQSVQDPGQFAALLPQMQPGLGAVLVPSSGTFWDSLNAYNAQLQHSLVYQSNMPGVMLCYGGQQQPFGQSCCHDAGMQYQQPQMAASGSEWPMPAHLVIPSQLQWPSGAAYPQTDLPDAIAAAVAVPSVVLLHLSGPHEQWHY